MEKANLTANLPVQTYYNSLVEICTSNGTTVGTGIAYADTRILTCAHVVAQALGLHQNVDEATLPPVRIVSVRRTYVFGKHSPPTDARVERFFGRVTSGPAADLAVLRVLNPSNFLHSSVGELPSFDEPP